MSDLKFLSLFIMIVFAVSCTHHTAATHANMDAVAERYVQLVLKVGLYDEDYVDSYFGPAALLPNDSTRAAEFPYPEFIAEVNSLLAALDAVDTRNLPDLHKQRHRFLDVHLRAARAKIEMLNGRQFTFDQESQRLYNAVAPQFNDSYFQDIIAELDALIPEGQTLNELLAQYRQQFAIPPAKLDTVFAVAIETCRTRSNQVIDAPNGEEFHMEFVEDKPWGAYNWYKGDLFSLIQVNTDRPLTVTRAIDLVAHEGYPGHHLFQILREKELVDKNGFVENTVIPLYAPVSLLAEGTAVYGEALIFSQQEKEHLARQVLFPLAGLDTTGLATYTRIEALREKLRYGSVHAARLYLDGDMTKEEAMDWLVTNTLSTPKRAAASLRFIEKYRSYIINYSLGYDLVKNYLKANGGALDNPERQWELFEALLTSQMVPGDLVVQ